MTEVSTPFLPRSHYWQLLQVVWKFCLQVTTVEKGSESDFFSKDLRLLPETSAPKEHLKLVFGSGNSDPTKARPPKVWTPAINRKSSLSETSIIMKIPLLGVSVLPAFGPKIANFLGGGLW